MLFSRRVKFAQSHLISCRRRENGGKKRPERRPGETYVDNRSGFVTVRGTNRNKNIIMS